MWKGQQAGRRCAKAAFFGQISARGLCSLKPCSHLVLLLFTKPLTRPDVFPIATVARRIYGDSQAAVLRNIEDGYAQSISISGDPACACLPLRFPAQFRAAACRSLSLQTHGRQVASASSPTILACRVRKREWDSTLKGIPKAKYKISCVKHNLAICTHIVSCLFASPRKHRQVET